MNQKGSVLIISIWILIILFTLTVSTVLYTEAMLKTSNKERDSFKSHTVFIAASHWIGERRLTGEVTVPKLWKDRLKIYSEDEEAKLNLNSASGPALLYLLTRLKEEKMILVDPKETVQNIIEYRANKPFELTEELLLLKGVSQQDIKVLKHSLTVYSTGQVNLNSASSLVLQSLIMTLPDYEDTGKQKLFDAILRFRESKDLFSSTDMSGEGLIDKLDLPHSPEMNGMLSGLLSESSANSSILRVEMKYEGKRKAEAVLKPSKDLPEILFWHEEGIGSYAA